MLTNVPSAVELNEIALRLYFDAWHQTMVIIRNFMNFNDSSKYPWGNGAPYADEWNDYLDQAQSELGAIAATAQQSAEIRLKAIICETSPFILLMKNDIKLKSSGGDIDFADQRTLDAADLPAAVNTLTPFPLAASYVKSYSELRRLRNRVMHTGLHQIRLEPQKLVQTLSEQYVALWPEGRWLFHRVKFDGNSASSYFVDGRYSSIHSAVMEELPYTTAVFDNKLFKKCIGTTKSSLKGHCPVCKSHTASKGGSETKPTASRNDASNAKCYMCESDLKLIANDTPCDCGSDIWANGPNDNEPCCFVCGQFWKYISE